ncbi:thermonuclease family protein [Salinarimonas rosea]|uniref:thermonuclease family protein n=1 Tax=Salinarimonas rosea TaxID=552063 RepID=UPI00042325D9|nr:thermonuclease family protein [Salinarimonas rosea]
MRCSALLPILGALAPILLLAATPPAHAADGEIHRGVARVVDGDTIALEQDGSGRDVRIRLFGIDAPEGDQACTDGRGRAWACGDVAARRLSDLAEGRVVSCEEEDRDQYERIVAICRIGGRDLNGTLVEEGLAFAYREFSERYVAQERAARRDERGVFAGSALAPWEHRAAQRAGSTDSVGPNGCTIKGNVGRSGRRLYHTPASPSFAETRIDETRGERWFCSEAQARAAGFAPAHP